MVEKTKGGARKEDVVTREYTINVHKPLHGWLCVGGQDGWTPILKLSYHKVKWTIGQVFRRHNTRQNSASLNQLVNSQITIRRKDQSTISQMQPRLLNGKSLINAANMKKYMCVATHQRNELKGSWVAFRSSILTVLMRFLPTSTLRYSDMRGKGHPNHKQRPSRRAAWKRNNTLSLRRYR
ncbi:60S ribosomal protein L15 [Tanacetum coccineum]|uniref:60S ribosomal protein L15 n=1 Tax=Tanacetum coccineum TaxID=301880 RepID=A0ABQ5IBY9_9ASTR